MNKHIKQITNWLTSYSESSKINSFIIGVSGGIDSALTSTLCAETGINTIVVSMPIHQHESQVERANDHIIWLKNKYDNVSSITIPLTHVYDSFAMLFADNENKLALANSRARLRMTTLYQIAQMNNGLVVGTGNKVEDFGVGFYTKYGDGGVDISPIADCTKTQVWELGKHLGISEEIIKAEPTDGLWSDGRNDADQLGMTYLELEKAMHNLKDPNHKKYLKIREKNLHKMDPIPVCKFNDS